MDGEGKRTPKTTKIYLFCPFQPPFYPSAAGLRGHSPPQPSGVSRKPAGRKAKQRPP
jgi:hypothetical protein